MTVREVAGEVFTRHLKNNPYPGRGLVVGRSERGGRWMIVYFIMGRSENSRNRRFVKDGDRLFTQPVDTSKVADPSLIIYDAMLALPGIHLVSNGDQTSTVYDALKMGGTFSEALATREREPDSPNFTPRITAMLNQRGKETSLSFSVLKANIADAANTDRYTICPSNPPPGIGYGLTTYMGDGNPLPSFAGDILVLPLVGAAEDVLDRYWDALDENNRVSLAVKEIEPNGSTGTFLVRNRHA